MSSEETKTRVASGEYVDSLIEKYGNLRKPEEPYTFVVYDSKGNRVAEVPLSITKKFCRNFFKVNVFGDNALRAMIECNITSECGISLRIFEGFILKPKLEK